MLCFIYPCPVYNSELCVSEHYTEAILFICCHSSKQFLNLDFYEDKVNYFKEICVFRQFMKRLVSLTACPLYNSELCGSAHDTEAILLVCCRRLFGFNLPKERPPRVVDWQLRLHITMVGSSKFCPIIDCMYCPSAL